MNQLSIRRAIGAGFALALGLLLSACLLAPGKFNSGLDIRKDGHFTFTYSGEINFLALSDLAKESNMAANEAVFTPEPCATSNGKERDCNSAELDRQMREWQEKQKAAAESKAREAEQMSAMMGGVDMSDPKAAEEFAASMRRQKGWKSVVYKGKGLFLVDYAISGALDHDFIFPAMEAFPMANTFIQISLRKDGSVRVDAPGYSPNGAGGPFKGLAQMAAMDGAKKDDTPQLPQIDGSFTLTTDGQILANNTEEGPRVDAAGSKLSWTINARSVSEPTALIKLSP